MPGTMKIKLQMTSKQQIDNYFTSNYTKLCKATVKIGKNANKMNFEPGELISLTYQHLLLKKDKMSPEQMESFCIRYITNQLQWNNSELSKLSMENAKNTLVEIIFDTEDSDDDFRYKIRMEKDYNEKKNCLYDFVKTLTNEEKIFYQAMYKGNRKVTINELKEKFNINRNYITKFRRDIQKKQREFINENYKK